MLSGENAQVTVSVRVRPKLSAAANALHSAERYAKMACTTTSQTTLKLWDGKSTNDSRTYGFSYDYIFDADATQEEVYEEAALDAVDCVLAGTNASVLAYGQTGSGKTYTILGRIDESLDTDAADAARGDGGLLMRAIQDILNYSSRVRAKTHVVVGISVVEIYLDEVRDLLNPSSTQGTRVDVALIKDAVRLPNLTVLPLKSLDDAVAMYRRAAAKRVQRATSANDTSSRSHAVFSLEVFQCPNTPACPCTPALQQCLEMRDAFTLASLNVRHPPKPIRSPFFQGAGNALMGTTAAPVLYSKLTVADLAGSEKAKHSDVRGEGFDELRRINASLTALGNVVHHLFECSRHIPYRDSKLTMILRDSFAAPGAHISMIVNVGPTALTAEETLSSLYFADKVKAMKVEGARLDPRAAKLEEDYLHALQLHDALVADLRICGCEQERQCVSFLPAGAALLRGASPLMNTQAHTVSPRSPERTAAMEALMARMKLAAAQESPEVRLQRFLNEQRVSTRQEILQGYLLRRATTSAEVEALQRAHEALTKWASDGAGAMKVALSEAKHQAVDAHEKRKSLAHKKESVTAALHLADVTAQKAEQQAQALVKSSGSESTELQALATRRKQDEDWLLLLEWAPVAVEVAELRSQLVTMLSDNAHIQMERAGCKLAVRDSAVSTKNMTVAEWLRHAVLAMAGNAVVQSTRRQKRRTRAMDPNVLQSLENFNATGPGTKYWVSSGRMEGTRHRAKYSAFDDPALPGIVLSYMKMGAQLRKTDKAGRLQRRLFYVSRKGDGTVRLCWEDPGRSVGLGEAHHLDVRSIERILLGQDAATFAEAALTTCSGEDGEGTTAEGGCAAFFRSFSLVYRAGRGDGPAKSFGVVCDSMQEMESWVVGLSNLSAIHPTYRCSAGPDDVATEDGGEGASAADLLPSEAALCKQWHIPVDTYRTAKRNITGRHPGHNAVRVTPGELRDLTRMDIFRSSALWLHLRADGLVHNQHLRRLYCYVKDPHTAPEAATSSSGSHGASDIINS